MKALIWAKKKDKFSALDTVLLAKRKLNRMVMESDGLVGKYVHKYTLPTPCSEYLWA